MLNLDEQVARVKLLAPVLDELETEDYLRVLRMYDNTRQETTGVQSISHTPRPQMPKLPANSGFAANKEGF